MLDQRALEIYIKALGETLFLVFGTAIFVVFIGFTIGFLLFYLEPNVLFKDRLALKITHKFIQLINDTARSIPFIILLILLIPFTRFIVGTMLGAKAALPALIISASPFFARIVHLSLKEVPKTSLEALKAFGASNLWVSWIVLKEALPALVRGLTLTLVTLVGFMSAAAVIGAGGLAFIAYEYGKFGSNYPLMYVSIITILILVFLIQFIGDFISKKIDHR